MLKHSHFRPSIEEKSIRPSERIWDRVVKTMDDHPPVDEQDFASRAEERPPSIVAEFLDFLIHNKKWWLTPIIVVLLLAGLLIVLSGTAAAPFIYTLW